MDKEKVKELLAGINFLKSTITDLNKQESDLLNAFGSPDFFFKDISVENFLNETILFKKCVLKYDGRGEFINPIELEEGKFLYKEVTAVIDEFLGTQFVNISFIDKTDSIRHHDETEHFSLMFRRIFDRNASGVVRANKPGECPESVSLGTHKTISEDKISVKINQVMEGCLEYKGTSFKNQNVLLFGPNIEESEYLIKLFDEFKPAKILNIVPIGGRRSFFDNVD